MYDIFYQIYLLLNNMLRICLDFLRVSIYPYLCRRKNTVPTLISVSEGHSGINAYFDTEDVNSNMYSRIGVCANYAPIGT